MSSADGSSMTTRVSNSQPLCTLTKARLPPELILEILEHLPRKDLRSVALVSHDFYERALQAGLRFSRVVLWSNIRNVGFENWLERLDPVLRSAADNRPGLNFMIQVLMSPTLDDAGNVAYRDGMRLLSPWILRALPNLVRLDIDFPPLTSDEEHTAFCENPAPKLRELAFFPRHDGPVLIPPNLFNGVAPRLHKLVLVCVSESMCVWQPIAAFAGVTHLKLTEQRTAIMPRLPLARLFPSLRVLAIDTGDCAGKQAIDIVGLTALRHFALAGDITLLTDGSRGFLRDISVFEHIPNKRGIEYCWPARCGDLCGVAERFGALPCVSFRPRAGPDAQWRRTVSPTPDSHIFADIPGLASNLVSLTLEEPLVADLVRSPVMLPALVEIFIDVSAADDAFGRLGFVDPRVHCPALVRVALFARAAAAPVALVADMVVTLGRALGLRGCRPALILAGCVWDPWFSPPPERMPLRHLFSSVGSVESAAAIVPEYYRTCRYSGHLEWHHWQ